MQKVLTCQLGFGTVTATKQVEIKDCPIDTSIQLIGKKLAVLLIRDMTRRVKASTSSSAPSRD